VAVEAVAVALTLLLAAVEAVDRLSSVKFLLLQVKHITFQLVQVDMVVRVQQQALLTTSTLCLAA
jgi:hypothetical protein